MKQPKKSSKKYIAATLSILAFIGGITLSILYATLPFFQTSEGALWKNTFLVVGLGLIALGLVGVIICILLYRRADRKEMKKRTERRRRLEDRLGSEDFDEFSDRVTYVPAQEVANFVRMGDYQTLEEKFDQISRMDKTQFVIYVARLFSRKGYQVKLTPVMDNHDIDLIVEKMGIVIAVGCLISNRVLSREEVVRVREGSLYYNVNNCMALTNMYYDRSAVDYARSEHISLVDRDLLAEDFMN